MKHTGGAKVKDLVAELLRVNQEAKVFIPGYEGGMTHLSFISVKEHVLIDGSGSYCYIEPGEESTDLGPGVVLESD